MDSSETRRNILMVLGLAVVLVLSVLVYLVVRALSPNAGRAPVPTQSAAQPTGSGFQPTVSPVEPTLTAPTTPTPVAATLALSETAVIYAGGGNRVYVSRDGGSSWISRTFTSTVQAVAAVTNTLGLVGYVGTRNADGTDLGLWMTTDGGDSFSLVSNLPRARGYITKPEFSLIAIDPVSPTQVYVGLKGTGTKSAKGALYRSGDNWTNDLLDHCHKTRPAIASTDCALTSLVIDPRAPNRLWIGQAGSDAVTQTVMLSTDSGKTWASKLSANVNYTAIAMMADNSDVLWALTVEGWTGSNVYRTENGGKTWTSINLKSQQNAMDHALLADARDPKLAWASGGLTAFVNGFGLQITRNGNASWTGTGVQYHALAYFGRRVLYGVPQSLLNEASVQRSEDEGKTWVNIGVREMGATLSMAPAPLSVVRFGTGSP